MDWGEIISYCISFAVGGGLSTLLTMGITKRKGNAEASNAEAAAKAAQLEYDSKLLEQNKTVIQRNTELVKESAELRDKLDTLSTSESVAKQNVCIHTTCPCRQPLRGLYEQSMAMDNREYLDILAEFFETRPFSFEDLQHRVEKLRAKEQ